MSQPRMTAAEAARRALTVISRAFLRKAHDDKKNDLQTVDIDVMPFEKHTKVERHQQYGASVVPKPPSGKGKAADAIVLYLGSDRAHPVVISVEDRRFRITGLKEGEVALYDDQQQRMYLTRDGMLRDTHKRIIDGVVTDNGQAEENAERDQSKRQLGYKTAVTQNGDWANMLKLDGNGGIVTEVWADEDAGFQHGGNLERFVRAEDQKLHMKFELNERWINRISTFHSPPPLVRPAMKKGKNSGAPSS